jgi:hypothetical protein
LLHSKKIVEMSVELEVRNNVYVPLAAVRDDPTYFIFGKSAFGIQQRISIQLDSGFAVEVVLVGLPTGEEV